ncbi:hypothetical protein [Leptothermofonsia sp. ETS-13]|uniref:hypothetical protein n=1 Tax=Leptothermofonsia sp. ETS-13 TaxID=3035696 RepID=UPI003B9E848E
MRPRLYQGQIRPKVSTLPRQKTEAAAYLDIYKLVNERKRLQQELEMLEQRRDRIQQRLTTIESQVAQLEETARSLKDSIPLETNPIKRDQAIATASFNTLFLEY